MKKLVLAAALLYAAVNLYAQEYPEPEFTNEIYFLKKDSTRSLMRLEKESSKLESKSKGVGFGGYENGYNLNGEKSSVRLNKGSNLSFVFWNGSSSSGSTSSPQQDSMMRANGMDPSAMSGMMGGMSDPANTISLYKANIAKGKRKILMQKVGGAFSGGKLQSSDKYTLSVKKIREGYWELVIDKSLPKGEYAFTAISLMGGSGMDGSATLFTFGVD